MDPQGIFCPNLDCPARGQYDQGNIGVHSWSERRYRCHVCTRTFSARKGTPLYRCRTPERLVSQVITLVAHGCPIPAVEAAFGLQRRTVQAWVDRAGQHCEQVHRHSVLQPRDLLHVQADEIRVKTQRGVVWLAMAVMVTTRLWLGGVSSAGRTTDLIQQLVALIHACALPGPLLVAVDGLAAYVTAGRRVFRRKQQTGRRGAPRLVVWSDLVLGQVVKYRCQRRLVAILRRLKQGTWAAAEALLAQTQGGGVLNTAYIERLNATFRARLAVLVRRTRGSARRQSRLHAGMYLVGTVYNFCSDHDSLRRNHQRCTPAMAAGITDHRWEVADLLRLHTPPDPWRPPKRRGRRSKRLQQVIDRWCV